MGNCLPFKRKANKYNEGTTPQLNSEGISLPNEDFISGIEACEDLDMWFLSQESLVSTYKNFEIINSWTTQERVKSLHTTQGLVLSGGRNIEVTNHSGTPFALLKGHERPLNALDSKGNYTVSGSSDWSVRVWDLNKCSEVSKSTINWNVVTSLKFISENTFVQTSEDLKIRVWDIRDGKPQVQNSIASGGNFATCCDVKDNYLVTGHRGFDNQGCHIKLWDLRHLKKLQKLQAHQQAVESVKFYENSVLSCGKDGNIFQFSQSGSLEDKWSHPQLRPFQTMTIFKGTILASNNEPKVLQFSINPLNLKM